MPAAIRRALISLSDKQGLVPFARGLVRLGFELLSTGGTRKALEEASVNRNIRLFADCVLEELHTGE